MAIVIRRKLHVAKLKDGWHAARIQSIELRNGVETYHGIMDQAIFIFLVGPECIKLKKSFNASLHEKSALSGFIQVLTGNIPGEEFDVESLQGRDCELRIGHKLTESGEVWEVIREIRGCEA